jgi:hypothetical protein
LHFPLFFGGNGGWRDWLVCAPEGQIEDENHPQPGQQPYEYFFGPDQHTLTNLREITEKHLVFNILPGAKNCLLYPSP